jgi:hypothetical protein
MTSQVLAQRNHCARPARVLAQKDPSIRAIGIFNKSITILSHPSSPHFAFPLSPPAVGGPVSHVL